MNAQKMKEWNQRMVVEATKKLLLAYGIQGTSVGMIAKKCDLNIRTVTRNFGSKENLVTIAMREYVGMLLKEMKQVLETKELQDKTGFETIMIFLDWFEDVLIQHYKFILLLNETEVYLSESKNEEARILLKKHLLYLSELSSIVHKELIKGVEDGSIRADANLEQAEELLTGVFKGLIQRLAVICNSQFNEDNLQVMNEMRIFKEIVQHFLE